VKSTTRNLRIRWPAEACWSVVKMLTSMKNMARVLNALDSKPAKLAITEHMVQSIKIARNRRPKPAFAIG
jgi:hypothetical protein